MKVPNKYSECLMNNLMINISCISNIQHALLSYFFSVFVIELLFKKCLPAMRLFFPYNSIAAILRPNTLKINLYQSETRNVNDMFAVIRLTMN